MNSAAHNSGTVNASPPTPLATQATYSVKSKSKSKAVAPSRRRKKSKTRFSLTGDKKKTKKKGAKRLGVDEQDKTWDAKQWDEYDWEILYIREVFKTFEGNLMYYVKWAGWEDDEEWRWQDAEYMDSCKELVSSFWDDLRAQAQKRFMTNVAFQRAMLCGKVLVPTAKWIRDQKSEYLEREPAPIPLEPGRRAISPGPWSELKPDFDPIQHVWKDAYNSTEGRARSADLIDSDTDSGDDFQDFQDFGQVESDDVQLTTRSPLVPRQLLPFGVAAPRSMLPSTSDIRFHTRPSAAIPPTPHSRGRPRFSVDEPTPSHGQYWTPDQYMRRILDRKVVAETHSWVGKEQVRLPNLPFFEGDRMQRSFGAMVLGPTSHISSDSVTALGHQAELTQHTDMSLNAQWQQPQRSHGRTFAVPEHQNASFTVSSDSGIDMDDDFFCPPEPFLNEHDNLNDAAGPIVSTDAGISQSGQEKRPDQLPKVQAAQPTSQAEPEPAVDPAPAAGSGWNTVSDSGITTTSAWGDPALTTTATGWGTEISGSNWQLAPTQRISQSDQGRLTTPPATHVNKCSDRQEKYSDQPPKVQVAQSTSQAEPEQAVNPASAAGSGWNSGTITTSGWGDPTCSTTAKGWGTEISGSNWQLAPILSYSGSSPTKSVDKLETTSWAKVDRAPRPQHLYLTTRSHNKHGGEDRTQRHGWFGESPLSTNPRTSDWHRPVGGKRFTALPSQKTAFANVRNLATLDSLVDKDDGQQGLLGWTSQEEPPSADDKEIESIIAADASRLARIVALAQERTSTSTSKVTEIPDIAPSSTGDDIEEGEVAELAIGGPMCVAPVAEVEQPIASPAEVLRLPPASVDSMDVAEEDEINCILMDDDFEEEMPDQITW